MAIPKFFLLFFCFLFQPSQASSGNCTPSVCGGNGSSLQIHFPFRLPEEQSEDCGYPGFNLRCSDSNKTVLTLPRSGEFYVRHIDYVSQQVHLYDPRGCLAKRILSLDLSGSVLVATIHQNYIFLSCPTQVVKSDYAIIGCLSNTTSAVLATSSRDLVASMPNSCEEISTVEVPVSWPVEFDEGFGTQVSDNDLRLTWTEPDCAECERDRGRCGFKDADTFQLGCFYRSKSEGPHTGFRVFRILCLAIVGPAVSCAIGIAIFSCLTDRASRRRQGSVQVAVTAQLPEPVAGLDEPTIQSIQKVVLGESRRLPGPNDSTCPICLSEYWTKETVKCIPECQHCFHADCIDEWLRMHSSCPICRNSPSPAPSSAHPPQASQDRA